MICLWAKSWRVRMTPTKKPVVTSNCKLNSRMSGIHIASHPSVDRRPQALRIIIEVVLQLILWSLLAVVASGFYT